MKLLSFEGPGGASWGIVRDGGIVDCGKRLGDRFADLRSVIAAGATAELGKLAAVPADLRLDDVKLRLPVPAPGRILCVGLNYKTHVAEVGRSMPEHPSLFLRQIGSLVAQGEPMRRPKASDNYDFEGELALVIGKAGRHIPAAEALAHIAGYTCFNDGSVRDFQKHSVTAGKNFEASGAMGPWLVTADEIPDPSRLTLETRLNGDVVQHAATDQLIYSIPTIIAYASTVMVLRPGDVIATGTPEGVGAGRSPPLWMKPGDVIEVTISGIGTLRNPIAAET